MISSSLTDPNKSNPTDKGIEAFSSVTSSSDGKICGRRKRNLKEIKENKRIKKMRKKRKVEIKKFKD